MKTASSAFGRLALAGALTLCAAQGGAQAAQFGPGWSLSGNGRSVVVDVPAVFGTKSAPVANVSGAVNTVWKWDAIGQKWAFFTPTMDMAELATYAAAKGYSVLKLILPGEGYWINAKAAVTIPGAAGQSYTIDRWQLASGWNLIATGAGVAPAAFNASIAPFSATTIWAWDSAKLNWYFYTPTLDSASLASYIAQKNYLDFGSLGLTDGRGFWVNRAAVSGSPTASLAPVEQAKAMFSELRTSFYSLHNSLNTGALDGQVRSMTADLNNVVVPQWTDLAYRLKAIDAGAKLYRDVKAGKTTGYIATSGAGSSVIYSTQQTDGAEYPAGVSFPGYRYGYGAAAYRCVTNAIAVTTPFASVTCSVYLDQYPTYTYNYADGTKSPNYIYNPSNPVTSQTQEETYASLNLSETAANTYAITAKAWKRTSGNSYVAGSAVIPTTTTQVGSTYTGTFQNTIDANGVTQAMALVADMPALVNGIDKLTVDVNGTHAVQVAGSPNATYRIALTGSISGVDAQGTTMLRLGLDSGSYFDQVENALGQPVGIDALKEAKLVGYARTQGLRFDGALSAKAVVMDADGKKAVPTDVSFSGSLTDLSPGGAGAILNGTVTAAISNFGAFHSVQAPSATNYEHATISFSGTLQLPSRPQMGLTLSGQSTGPTTGTISGQYTYGNGVTITISGTQDGSNSAADSLTLTNQDGVAVTIGANDGTITKAGAALGTIQSGVIYYSDGVFESLN